MFQGIKCVVQGADHIAKNKICQDAAGIWTTEKYGVAVVADGHGSDKYIRSDIGSKKAVEAAIATVKAYMEDYDGFSEAIQKNSSYVLNRMKEYFFSYWTQEVEEYNDENPLTEEEKAILAKTKAEDISFYTYYGSTVLAAVMTEDYAYGFLVGDGGFIIVDADGKVRIPIEDENSHANYTSSICSKNAISATNAFFEKNRPLSMCVSTDGLIKSFGTEEDFKDYHVLLSTMLTNMENCQVSLFKNLDKRTKSGSGDDISVAVVFEDARILTGQDVLKQRIEQNKMRKKVREEQQRLDVIKFQKQQEMQNRKALLANQKQIESEIQKVRNQIDESEARERKAKQQIEELNNRVVREKQDRDQYRQYLSELEMKEVECQTDLQRLLEKSKKLLWEEGNIEKGLRKFFDVFKAARSKEKVPEEESIVEKPNVFEEQPIIERPIVLEEEPIAEEKIVPEEESTIEAMESFEEHPVIEEKESFEEQFNFEEKTVLEEYTDDFDEIKNFEEIMDSESSEKEKSIFDVAVDVDIEDIEKKVSQYAEEALRKAKANIDSEDDDKDFETEMKQADFGMTEEIL